jgi:hypothetical protein
MHHLPTPANTRRLCPGLKLQNQNLSTFFFFFSFLHAHYHHHLFCNLLRPNMSVAKQTTTAVDAEKVAFIEAALKNGVLLFGEFTLKSGR